ncbi:MAG: STAS domain-containing protein [Bacteroidota bacterium]
MALEIKESRGIFEILGKVSSQNLGALKIYFESVLETTEEMIVSLEGVTEMDSSAALFFESFYLESVKQNKVVVLVGKQNQDISAIMDITNTNYILSSDRV